MFGDPGSLSASDLWLLPDGVEELLPPEAMRVEELRRRLLDLYHSWGYELIVPPLIEYLESLLTGAGRDLELQTFKVTDQLTGRMMGVRADMTPQASRIDARSQRDGANRICYLGSVLRTKPQNMLSSRSPIQTGCELFGVADTAADIEVISLMLETLRLTRVSPIHMDIAHVGIYQLIQKKAALSPHDSELLLNALKHKAVPEINDIATLITDPQVQEYVRALPRLAGGLDKLSEARELFSGEPDVLAALDEMLKVSEMVAARYPEVEICIDLCELRGFNYHTGLVFAAYTSGLGQAVAQGGRYDGVGREFGNARPATGFSVDLKALFRLGQTAWKQESKAVLAPNESDPGLWDMIADLRTTERVVQLMPGESKEQWKPYCDRELVKDETGSWVVNKLV
ncbi:ATP phosphoribosyltransferase regulatory subunit [Hahella sp. CCB-MM4]|uniref:ATP phosphoribosyltransferase regulatory subunit n=1 Tax=Hahella sp. (strain CCB-MM4) TaxID=1926491 RepID=UPI000B9ADEA4|nr:ATP phosphoribosyltransferase regulatory subunit [Hahella sp. CCB-MM4]OZG71658.1 ATP phosphoribosyltransferase regulatory subunit [Hahella sp. CCB-MM4]